MYVYPLSSPAIAVVDNEVQRILEYSPHGPLVLLTLSQSSLTAPCALFHVLSSMFCSEVLLGCCFYCDSDIRRAGVFHFHSIVKMASIKNKHQNAKWAHENISMLQSCCIMLDIKLDRSTSGILLYDCFFTHATTFP